MARSPGAREHGGASRLRGEVAGRRLHARLPVGFFRAAGMSGAPREARPGVFRAADSRARRAACRRSVPSRRRLLWTNRRHRSAYRRARTRWRDPGFRPRIRARPGARDLQLRRPTRDRTEGSRWNLRPLSGARVKWVDGRERERGTSSARVFGANEPAAMPPWPSADPETLAPGQLRKPHNIWRSAREGSSSDGPDLPNRSDTATV